MAVPVGDMLFVVSQVENTCLRYRYKWKTLRHQGATAGMKAFLRSMFTANPV